MKGWMRKEMIGTFLELRVSSRSILESQGLLTIADEIKSPCRWHFVSHLHVSNNSHLFWLQLSPFPWCWQRKATLTLALTIKTNVCSSSIDTIQPQKPNLFSAVNPSKCFSCSVPTRSPLCNRKVHSLGLRDETLGRDICLADCQAKLFVHFHSRCVRNGFVLHFTPFAAHLEHVMIKPPKCNAMSHGMNQLECFASEKWSLSRGETRKMSEINWNSFSPSK